MFVLKIEMIRNIVSPIKVFIIFPVFFNSILSLLLMIGFMNN